MSGQFDDILASIASHHKSVEGLLHTFFSFLNNRTDFYVVDDNPGRRMGFAPGQAQKIVCISRDVSISIPLLFTDPTSFRLQMLDSFLQFPYRDKEGRPIIRATARIDSQVPSTPSSAQSSNSAFGNTSGKKALAPTVSQSPSTATAAKVAPQNETSSKMNETVNQTDHIVSTSSKGSGEPNSTPSKETSTATPIASTSLHCTVVRYNDKGEQLPISNGGVGPGYWWSQTLSDVTMNFVVPGNVEAKELNVSISNSALKVTLAGHGTPIIDVKLQHEILAHDSLWNIDSPTRFLSRPIDVLKNTHWSPAGSGALDPDLRLLQGSNVDSEGKEESGEVCRVVSVYLEKKHPRWWTCLGEGQPSIDGTRIDSTQPIEAYDAETQAAIRKIIAEQTEKAKAIQRGEIPDPMQAELANALSIAKSSPDAPDFISGIDVSALALKEAT